VSLYKSTWTLSAVERRASTTFIAKEHPSHYNSFPLEFQCEITKKGIAVGDNHHSSFFKAFVNWVEWSMSLVYTTLKQLSEEDYSSCYQLPAVSNHWHTAHHQLVRPPPPPPQYWSVGISKFFLWILLEKENFTTD